MDYTTARAEAFAILSAAERRAQLARTESQTENAFGLSITCTVSAEGKKYAARWTCNGKRLSYDAVRAALIEAVMAHADSDEAIKAKRDERTQDVLRAFRGHREEFNMLRGVLLMSTNWSASDAIAFKDQWVDSMPIAARMDELNAEAIASIKAEREAKAGA